MDNEDRRRAFKTETSLRKASEVGECRILMESWKGWLWCTEKGGSWVASSGRQMIRVRDSPSNTKYPLPWTILTNWVHNTLSSLDTQGSHVRQASKVLRSLPRYLAELLMACSVQIGEQQQSAPEATRNQSPHSRVHIGGPAREISWKWYLSTNGLYPDYVHPTRW